MLSYEENHVNKFIREAGGLPAIKTATNMLEDWGVNGIDHAYESKAKRLHDWNPDKGELYELTIAVWTATLLNKTLTIQAITGLIAGRINLDTRLASAKTAAEVIAVISKSGLITIMKRGSGRSILVKTTWKINKEIPTLNRHMPLVKKPNIVIKNFDDDLGSMILGGAVKHHEGNICLDHINRMNQIPLKLNEAFLCKIEEAPSKKMKLDTKQKVDQWKLFMEGSYDMYIKLARISNSFWLDHKYDTRGRSYAINYYVSTQGSSFKKAIVQLANKEKVEM